MLKRLGLSRKVKWKIQIVFFFLCLSFIFCVTLNWFTIVPQRQTNYVSVPAYLLAKRNIEIPLQTKIYVDSKADTLIEFIEKDKYDNENLQNIDNTDDNLQKITPIARELSSELIETSRPKDGRSQENSVNVLIWDEICGEELDSLKNYPLFPKLPSRKLQNQGLIFQSYGSQIGVLVVGYLITKCEGYYYFDLINVNGVGEFWISRDEKPNNLLFVSSTKSKKLKELYLEKKKKYFFAFLYKVGESKTTMQVSIKNQDILCNVNGPVDFHPYFSWENDSVYNELDLDFPWNSCQVPHSYSKEEYDSKRRNIYNLPFIDDNDVLGIFPTCKSAPKYIVKKVLGEYDGVWETKYSSIYPSDRSNITEILSSGRKQIIFGNVILEEEIAVRIAQEVMQAIEKKNPWKYKLQSILNIEKNPETKDGARYLVELELFDTAAKQLVRFSEYVCEPKSGERLCFPENFRWNKKAVVNLILTVGGQGRWAKHFINSINEIYKATKDKNINLIIVDFSSKYISLQKELDKTSIPRYVFLSRNGGFFKSEAIQQAANTILDPNGIVLLMDLHLLMPLDLIDNVRKHCVQGKMTFNPILARLRCGANCKNPHGFWEITGYGIFATFKSDWDAFGGMNYAKFKNRWGGEDWEMLDRVLMKNLEVERLKIKDFYHVFHTKKGMWNAFKT